MAIPAVRITGLLGEQMTYTYPTWDDAGNAAIDYLAHPAVQSAEVLSNYPGPRLADPDAIIGLLSMAADYLTDFAEALKRKSASERVT